MGKIQAVFNKNGTLCFAASAAKLLDVLDGYCKLFQLEKERFHFEEFDYSGDPTAFDRLWCVVDDNGDCRLLHFGTPDTVNDVMAVYIEKFGKVGGGFITTHYVHRYYRYDSGSVLCSLVATLIPFSI